ncbi:MAG: hypothetical protein BWY75_02523 [bacterium ADurb.Bin425]|nr:MAG: hypothetical protein BWY75_02523 [bacterium ADurb.Bin425]
MIERSHFFLAAGAAHPGDQDFDIALAFLLLGLNAVLEPLKQVFVADTKAYDFITLLR